MKTHFNKITLVVLLAVFLTLQSCQKAGVNSTGSEYMPDMAHSVAYESNYYNYYYNNTWGSEDEYYQFAQPKKPVNGTIPRGMAGMQYASDDMEALKVIAEAKGLLDISSKSITPNGSVPYYYENTEEDRLRAMEELIDNPFPITDEGLARAKELYNTFCGICHGEKGDGAGYLVRDDGGVYPAAPANFLLPEHVNASNGRYYHAIMHGRNLMGAYADKLSYEERWQVIHYIRSLQAKDAKLAYNQLENTLNDVDSPAGESGVQSIEMFAAKYDDHMDHHTGHDDMNHNNHHGDDHGHDGSHEHDDEHHGESHSDHKDHGHEDH